MTKSMQPVGLDQHNACPLSGAAKAVSMIEGAMMLIIGTAECAYYTKFTMGKRGFGDCCFSVVLSPNDYSFGSIDTVSAAAKELLELYQPSSLYLITTCLVGIIGDDFTALVHELGEQYHTPVKLIETNHYTGKDAGYGMDLVYRQSHGCMMDHAMWKQLKARRGVAK